MGHHFIFVKALEIIGTDQVEGVRVANIDSKGNIITGSEKIYEADFVCIAGGLYPLSLLLLVVRFVIFRN